MKRIFTILIGILLLSSCANSKTFKLENVTKSTGEHVLYETITVVPYGWWDVDELKNPNIIYKPCVGNIVWSVILCQTIVVPIWLTGWEFYEPIKVKDCYPDCN